MLQDVPFPSCFFLAASKDAGIEPTVKDPWIPRGPVDLWVKSASRFSCLAKKKMLLCNICFLKRKTYNQNISKQFEKKLWNLFGSIGSKTGNGTNHHLLMLNPQHCPLLRPFDGAKWMWYPQIIHFNRVFHYKPSILGCPYFWKHPNGHPFSSTHHDRHQLQESIACRFPQNP